MAPNRRIPPLGQGVAFEDAEADLSCREGEADSEKDEKALG